MNLYLVTRWGNNDHPDGPNGPDTSFVVRALDHLSAVSLVEAVLEQMPRDRVSARASQCLCIGVDSGASTEPLILLGPIVEYAYNRGDYKVGWIRTFPDDEWMTLDDFMKGFEA